MTQDTLLKQLREAIDRAKGPEAGTVVRFELVHRPSGRDADTEMSASRRYTYAAVFANNRWYVTGKFGFHGEHSFTHGRFVSDVLANDEVENITIATEYTTV